MSTPMLRPSPSTLQYQCLGPTINSQTLNTGPDYTLMYYCNSPGTFSVSQILTFVLCTKSICLQQKADIIIFLFYRGF